MDYLSICSGFGGAELAFEPLGWNCVAVSEIEPAACSVLKSRWPNTLSIGDFTRIGATDVGPIDLLVGGTPCQSFSIAGLRGGLGDDRGNLALEFLRLADRTRPRWILWENVPGVYSATSHVAPDPCPPEIDLDSPDGPKDGEEIVVEDEYDADEDHAFSCFLAGLSELGYGYAYRTLDARYFGVPQRRRRVFVVAYLGNGNRARAVLFERNCLSWNSPKSKEKGQSVAGCLKGGSGKRGYPDPSDGNGGGLVDVTGTLAGGSGERLANTLGTRNSDGRNERGDGSGNQIATWPAEVTQTLDSHYGDKQGLEDQHIRGGATLFVPCSNLPSSEGRRPNDGQLCGDRGFL